VQILFYDVVKSFLESSEDKGRQIINTSGKGILSHSIWCAGKNAIDVLLPNMKNEKGESAGTLADLNDLLPTVAEQANAFLDEAFFPDMMEMISSGRVIADESPEKVREYWEAYQLPSKALMFLQFINATPQALFNEHSGPLIRQIAAISTIYRIDDCALAVLDEGAGMDEAALDIERLRNFVSPSSSLQYALEAGKKAAFKERATELASRRHQPTNKARAWVIAEWSIHKSAYIGNKSAFARDYVGRLRHELGVSVTEKQLREVWLKDTPPASKPDGLPANG
jgi:hypothetical protein